MRYHSIAHHALSVCALVLVDASSRMHQGSLNAVDAFVRAGCPRKMAPKTPSASRCSHRTRRMLSLRECVHVWLTARSAFFFARRIVFCRTSSVPRSHLRGETVESSSDHGRTVLNRSKPC